jgi:hypothetical protein
LPIFRDVSVIFRGAVVIFRAASLIFSDAGIIFRSAALKPSPTSSRSRVNRCVSGHGALRFFGFFACSNSDTNETSPENG